MEHLLLHYFLANGNNHEIQKMFTEVDFYDFEELTSANKQSFVEMERATTGGKTKRSDDRKINLLNNVVLYYNFLWSDTSIEALVEDHEHWVVEDFKKLRSRGRHHTAAFYAALLAGATNTTTSTATTTVVAPKIKVAEDAWLSWQQSKRNADKYPILQNDREYTNCIVITKQQFEAERCTRVITDTFTKFNVK